MNVYCAEEYDCPLWEASWIFSTDKIERGEQALRTLIENNLVVFSPQKAGWKKL